MYSVLWIWVHYNQQPDRKTSGFVVLEKGKRGGKVHNILILNMEHVPQSVCDNNPMFWEGVFNKDKTKRLLDGYKIDPITEEVLQPPTLVHLNEVLLYWCRYESNPQYTIDLLLETSEILKPSIYKLESINPLSEWYIEGE